ncbi:MAG: hypothetical protein E7168_04070 [Firmicutes bacterium]|nr:hypothetical protein [Bacillota bacterium]
MDKKKDKKMKLRLGLSAKSVYYFVMILVFIYLIVAGMYKYHSTQDLYSCSMELIFLLLLSGIIQCVHLSDFDENTNKVVFRNKLVKKKEKKERLKFYLYEAGFISLMITTCSFLFIALREVFIDFYSIIPASVVLSILAVVFVYFLLFFIVFFIVDYLLGESLVKKYGTLAK